MDASTLDVVRSSRRIRPMEEDHDDGSPAVPPEVELRTGQVSSPVVSGLLSVDTDPAEVNEAEMLTSVHTKIMSTGSVDEQFGNINGSPNATIVS